MSVNTVCVPYITLRHELLIDPRLRMGTFLLFGVVLVFSSLFVDGPEESLFVDGRDESIFVDGRVEFLFVDGRVESICVEGREESFFVEGRDVGLISLFAENRLEVRRKSLVVDGNGVRLEPSFIEGNVVCLSRSLWFGISIILM